MWGHYYHRILFNDTNQFDHSDSAGQYNECWSASFLRASAHWAHCSQFRNEGRWIFLSIKTTSSSSKVIWYSIHPLRISPPPESTDHLGRKRVQRNTAADDELVFSWNCTVKKLGCICITRAVLPRARPPQPCWSTSLLMLFDWWSLDFLAWHISCSWRGHKSSSTTSLYR